jgi:hypothetical protein
MVSHYRFSSGGLCHARPFSPPWRSSPFSRVAPSAAPLAIISSPRRAAEPYSQFILSWLATFCPYGLRGGLRRVSVLDLLPHWPSHSLRACHSPARYHSRQPRGFERPGKTGVQGAAKRKAPESLYAAYLAFCHFFLFTEAQEGLTEGSQPERSTPRCRLASSGPWLPQY